MTAETKENDTYMLEKKQNINIYRKRQDVIINGKYNDNNIKYVILFSYHPFIVRIQSKASNPFSKLWSIKILGQKRQKNVIKLSLIVGKLLKARNYNIAQFRV